MFAFCIRACVVYKSTQIAVLGLKSNRFFTRFPFTSEELRVIYACLAGQLRCVINRMNYSNSLIDILLVVSIFRDCISFLQLSAVYRRERTFSFDAISVIEVTHIIPIAVY